MTKQRNTSQVFTPRETKLASIGFPLLRNVKLNAVSTDARSTKRKKSFEIIPSVAIPPWNQSRAVYLSCQRNSDSITAIPRSVCQKDILSSQLLKFGTMFVPTAMDTLNVRKVRWVSKVILARVVSGQLSTGKQICSRVHLLFCDGKIMQIRKVIEEGLGRGRKKWDCGGSIFLRISRY